MGGWRQSSGRLVYSKMFCSAEQKRTMLTHKTCACEEHHVVFEKNTPQRQFQFDEHALSQ